MLKSNEIDFLQNCPLSVLLPPSLFLLMVLDSKVHGQISLFGLEPPTHGTLKIVLGFQRLLVTATIAFFVFRDCCRSLRIFLVNWANGQGWRTVMEAIWLRVPPTLAWDPPTINPTRVNHLLQIENGCWQLTLWSITTAQLQWRSALKRLLIWTRIAHLSCPWSILAE